MISLKRGELALGRRAALSHVGVVYPLTQFAFPHAAWSKTYDLVSCISLQDGPHYVTHAVLTRDRAVRVNTHDSARSSVSSVRNNKGPDPGRVCILVYQLTELCGNIHQAARGLQNSDNRCYLNALLHSLVYTRSFFRLS